MEKWEKTNKQTNGNDDWNCKKEQHNKTKTVRLSMVKTKKENQRKNEKEKNNSVLRHET